MIESVSRSSAHEGSAAEHQVPTWKRYVSWELVLVLALSGIFLLPTLKTGYISDDAGNSSFLGEVQAAGTSSLGASWDYVHYQLTANGRWFPLSTYYGAVLWRLVQSLLLYKILQIAGVLLALGATWALLRSLRFSRASASLVVLTIGMIPQLRDFPDPILSFTSLVEITWTLVAVALIGYQRWLVGGRRRWLVASLLIFAVACSTYEGVYLLAPLFVVLAFWEKRAVRATIRASIPPLAVSLVFVMLGTYLRSHSTAGATGPWAPNFDPHEVLDTVTDQLLAAVPLSYRAFDPSHLFAGSLFSGVSVTDILVGAGFAAAFGLLLSRQRSAPRRPLTWKPLSLLVLLGLLVWVLTAGPVGVANQYQSLLVAGIGHIPVFYGYIGVGLVLAGLGGAAVRRFGRTGVVTIALVAGLVATLTSAANDVIAERMVPARQQRDAETAASEAGLYADATPNSTLFVQMPTPSQSYQEFWANRGFYRTHTGKTFTVVPGAQVTDPTARDPAAGGCAAPAPGRLYTSLDVVQDRGIVALTCIDAPGAGRTLLYLWHLRPAQFALSADVIPQSPTRPGGSLIGTGTELLAPVPGRAGLWRLRSPGPIDPRTLTLIRDIPPVMSSWTAGCFPATLDPANRPVLPCKRTSALTLDNTTGRPQSVVVSFRVLATGPGGTRVTVAGRAGQTTVALTGGAGAYRAPMTLPPGRTVVRVRTNARPDLAAPAHVSMQLSPAEVHPAATG